MCKACPCYVIMLCNVRCFVCCSSWTNHKADSRFALSQWETGLLHEETSPSKSSHHKYPLNRKYKDYVYGRCLYRSTWKNKEYLRSKDKAKNHMIYQDIYNCICHNTQKRYTIHYVTPAAQLLFKNRFPKGGPTYRRQVVNPRHQTPQGQSVTKPDTPLLMGLGCG